MKKRMFIFGLMLAGLLVHGQKAQAQHQVNYIRELVDVQVVHKNGPELQEEEGKSKEAPSVDATSSYYNVTFDESFRDAKITSTSFSAKQIKQILKFNRLVGSEIEEIAIDERGVIIAPSNGIEVNRVELKTIAIPMDYLPQTRAYHYIGISYRVGENNFGVSVLKITSNGDFMVADESLEGNSGAAVFRSTDTGGW